jgi:hypothetical protein
MQIEKFFLKKGVHGQFKAPSSTEENISDLLSLANEELERKSKLVYELESRIEYLEGNNLEAMGESQLNQLKNFYGTKLSSIVSALNSFK